MTFHFFILILACHLTLTWAKEKACAPFQETYHSGKEFADRFWAVNGTPSFRYIPKSDMEYEHAYTMWFFDSINPNDEVSNKRINSTKFVIPNMTKTDLEICHLADYSGNMHLEKPIPQDETFTECHPWAAKSCCTSEAVNSGALKNKYGKKWVWDVCGSLTPACERFFVQEGCFYDCDVNVGLWRKVHVNHGNCDKADLGGCADEFDSKEWILDKMPIKGDYFDAMYLACRGNMFCASEDFSECYTEYEMSKHATIGPLGAVSIAVSCLLIVVGGVLLLVMINRRLRSSKRSSVNIQPISGVDSWRSSASKTSFEVCTL